MSFDDLEIPDKKHFKIGEVAGLLDLEPYVLRYWETEFDVLSPDKTDSGQRVYAVDDIELVYTIRHLLYDEMFTIAGARRQLKRRREGKSSLLGSVEQPEVGASELAEQIEALESEKEELEQESARRLEQLDRVRDERDDYVARAERLEAKVAQFSSDGGVDEEMEAENVALHEEVEHLESELEKARAVISKLRDESEELRQRLDGAAAISPDLLSALKREVSELRGVARPS